MQDDFIVVPKNASLNVSLGPVQNFINSLILLNKTDQLPGLNNWLVETYRSMNDQEKLNNRIIAMGLFYSFAAVRDRPSVPEYLSNLVATKPEQFRDRLLMRYATAILLDKTAGNPGSEKAVKIDKEKVLKNENTYLEFIKDNFCLRYTDFEIEALSYEYLTKTGYELVWKKQLSPTEFEYCFRLKVKNMGCYDANNVTIEIKPAP